MPFTNSVANAVLNVLLGKTVDMKAKTTVYIALGNVPTDADKNPVFDKESDTLGFAELSAATNGNPNGYSRILVARRNSKISGTTATTETDSTFPHIGEAKDRAIQNTMQINWTKAVVDWDRVNAFALATSPEVGETETIYFVGGLKLSAADKAAGGLLVQAGAVALFDPEAFKIEFPAKDVAVE